MPLVEERQEEIRIYVVVMRDMLGIGPLLAVNLRPEHVPRSDQRMLVAKEIPVCEHRFDVPFDLDSAGEIRLRYHQRIERCQCVHCAVVRRDEREPGLAFAEDALRSVGGLESECRPVSRSEVFLVSLCVSRGESIDVSAHSNSPGFQNLKSVPRVSRAANCMGAQDGGTMARSEGGPCTAFGLLGPHVSGPSVNRRGLGRSRRQRVRRISLGEDTCHESLSLPDPLYLDCRGLDGLLDAHHSL